MRRNGTSSALNPKGMLILGIILIGISALFIGLSFAFLSAAKEELSKTPPYPEANIVLYLMASENVQDFITDSDAVKTRKEILRLCYNSPEMLASTAAAFPCVVEAADLPLGDLPPTAENIDNLMDRESDGAEIQQRLFDALNEALNRVGTRYELLALKTDWVNLRYVVHRDKSEPVRSSNLGLVMVPVYPEIADYVAITVTAPDGSYQRGFFYVAGGFQYADIGLSTTPEDPELELPENI